MAAFEMARLVPPIALPMNNPRDDHDVLPKIGKRLPI